MVRLTRHGFIEIHNRLIKKEIRVIYYPDIVKLKMEFPEFLLKLVAAGNAENFAGLGILLTHFRRC